MDWSAATGIAIYATLTVMILIVLALIVALFLNWKRQTRSRP
jgi:ABC-type sugar transport system permease subunit